MNPEITQQPDRYSWTAGELTVTKKANLKKGLVSKPSVQYTDNASNSDEQCRFCQFFNVSSYTCQKVAGSISPEGWCELFEAYEPQGSFFSGIHVDLTKHCGVCEEDDAYAGAPIAREITIIFPRTNHANGVEIIAMMAPGLPPKPALWKPEGGEDFGLIDWIGGPQYPREEAAYRLDRALGFYLVPVAYVAEANDERGAAVYYTENALPAKPPLDYSWEWIEKAGVLDYLICQKDRGYKHNYLTHPDNPGRMVLYDNGLSFPADGNDHCSSPFASAVIGQELSSEVMTALNLCLGDVICWARLIGLVGPVAADAVRDRIKTLVTSGWPAAAELRKEFRESEHERDSHGRFGAGGGGAGVHPEPTMRPVKPVGKRGTGKWGKEGGSYRRVRDEAVPGEEVHHMPAAQASPLHPLNGPCIKMSEEDHAQTASFGNRRASIEYRDKQRKLIQAGKFHEAQQMDIDDIRKKFGNKYDAAINEMKSYTSNLKYSKHGVPRNFTDKEVKAGLA